MTLQKGIDESLLGLIYRGRWKERKVGFDTRNAFK
jgi:hypothetical protein